MIGMAAVESGRYSYPVYYRPPTGGVNGNGRSFRPGDVSYVIPSEGSYYKERPSRHAFFYSESRFPGIPSLPRVPAGLESLQQAPEPRYPTAHAGVDITNAIFNPGKISRHDVESERYFHDIAAESPIAMAPPDSLPLPVRDLPPRMDPMPPRGYPRPYEAIIYGPVIPRAGTSGLYASAVGQAYPLHQSQPTLAYIDKGASLAPEPQQARSATSTPFSTLGGLFNAAWAELPPRPVRQSAF